MATDVEEPTLESLMRRGVRIVAEIDQLEQKVLAWNLDNPDEEPLDWDPDGQMLHIRAATKATIDEIRRRIAAARLVGEVASRG